MTDTRSSHQWLSEAQSLAFSVELLAFCDAQHSFIDHDVDDEVVRQKAVGLAREARRRRLEPQILLFAMELGGCYRSHQLEDRADPEPARVLPILPDTLVTHHPGCSEMRASPLSLGHAHRHVVASEYREPRFPD